MNGLKRKIFKLVSVIGIVDNMCQQVVHICWSIKTIIFYVVTVNSFGKYSIKLKILMILKRRRWYIEVNNLSMRLNIEVIGFIGILKLILVQLNNYLTWLVFIMSAKDLFNPHNTVSGDWIVYHNSCSGY